MRRIIMLAAAAILTTMAHGQNAETYAPTVPLMLPASDSFLQSFVRLINKSDQAGEVEITAVLKLRPTNARRQNVGTPGA